MKLVLDMNLSPQWVPVLKQAGHEALHWSGIGDPAAPDRTIMQWAHAHDRIVFTHDLDFSALLAATQADGPSVLQVRTQDVLPAALAPTVLAALKQFHEALEAGAIVTIDAARVRARILPLRQTE